jgi:hypothetical protein
VPTSTTFSEASRFCGLERCECHPTIRQMKLFFAFLVWLLMGGVLVKGLIMAVDGKLWLLIVGLLGFIVLVGKIGCLSHD